VVVALGIGALVALHQLRAPGIERVPVPFLIVLTSFLLTTLVMFGYRRYMCVIDWMFLLSAAYLVGGAWWPEHDGGAKGCGPGSARRGRDLQLESN
jgi:hypothetical protein